MSETSVPFGYPTRGQRSRARPLLWRSVALLLAALLHAEAAGAARLVPPADGPDVNTLGVERDGTRRVVTFGLRALVHTDSSIEVADEVFPLARGIQTLELPERFGRGVLFWISAAGHTAVWKAANFVAHLEPFAGLDFEVERMLPGFDRVYVQARRSGEWFALDAESGAGLERGSLPPAPGYGALAVADEWFGAVELPIAGVTLSFDAGNTWHALPRTFKLLGEDDGALLLSTPDGRRRLSSDGALHPESMSVALSDVEVDVGRRALPEGPLGRTPLATALLHGFPESAESALVLFRGALSRVRLSDGRALETRQHLVSVASDCVGVALNAGPGFVCRDPTGKTQIYALKAPLSLELVRSFDSPRAILASGNGGLVMRGGCGSDAHASARNDLHCVMPPAREAFEVRVSGDVGVERVVALRDGSAALFVPPRAGQKGTLSKVLANGSAHAVPLVFDARDDATRSILNKGFWLDGMVESARGGLSGWVTSQGTFVGVWVSFDGHVRAGPIRRGIERALLAGERALVIPAAGIAEQSVDGGVSFTDVDLPPELQLDSARMARLPLVMEQGCSALGCAFSGWLRVGWDGVNGGKPLRVAVAPVRTALPQPGGGRWILRCALDGEPSAEALPVAPRTNSDSQPSWVPLFEQPAPSKPRDALSFDTGGDGELRAYAWAPRGADFGKAGSVVVSALDAYRTRGGVWSTLPAASPWSDPAQLSEVFGYEGSSPSAWRLLLDPSGRAGVLSVNARGTVDLFAVEENRALSPLLNASRNGIGPLASVVTLGSTYYVAANEEPRSLRVFAIDGGQARLVGEYADLLQGRGSFPRLVRSAHGDALGIWTRGPGWYVFPIDLRTGTVSRAIEIPARSLAHLPPSCAPDEEGYLLEGSLGIEPYVDFMGGAERVSAHGYEGRFVLSDRGLCVVALAARSDGALERNLRARSPTHANGSVPLVVSDRSDRGRRWSFRCGD